MILGIDPATKNSGIALVDDSVFPAKMLHTQAIKTSWVKKFKHVEYLEEIKRVVESLQKYTHDLKKIKIFIEKPIPMYQSGKIRNLKGLESHNEIMSLWKLCLQMYGLKYTVLTPSQWQNPIGTRSRGTGLTVKEQVKNIVICYYNIPYLEKKEWTGDQFDALGIAHYGVVTSAETQKSIYNLFKKEK
jgi:Holliday junction resolvasome RuvABC endonuclease subunit